MIHTARAACLLETVRACLIKAVSVFTALLFVRCSSPSTTDVPVIGTLSATYSLSGIPIEAFSLALLERPSEGRVYLIGSPGRMGSVQVLASGVLSESELVELAPDDRVLVEDVQRPQLVVADVNGDGDDDVLIQAGAESEEAAIRAGYDPELEWRERVWVATNPSAPARLIVDVIAPGLHLGFGPLATAYPVQGESNTVGVFTLATHINWLTYRLERSDMSSVCIDLTCVHTLDTPEGTISGTDLAVAGLGDTLAVSFVDVRSTGHLTTEWYRARSLCRADECSPIVDLGPTNSSLGQGLLPSGASEPYFHVASLAATVRSTTVDASLDGSGHSTGIVEGSLSAYSVSRDREDGWWRLTGIRWTDHAALSSIRFDESGASILGDYAFDWTDGAPYLDRVNVRATRSRSMYIAWPASVEGVRQQTRLVELPR